MWEVLTGEKFWNFSNDKIIKRISLIIKELKQFKYVILKQ